MNSKRKKKTMAATMALASVSAKSKINAALNGDIQIGKKSRVC